MKNQRDKSCSYANQHASTRNELYIGQNVRVQKTDKSGWNQAGLSVKSYGIMEIDRVP